MMRGQRLEEIIKQIALVKQRCLDIIFQVYLEEVMINHDKEREIFSNLFLKMVQVINYIRDRLAILGVVACDHEWLISSIKEIIISMALILKMNKFVRIHSINNISFNLSQIIWISMSNDQKLLEDQVISRKWIQGEILVKEAIQVQSNLAQCRGRHLDTRIHHKI